MRIVRNDTFVLAEPEFTGLKIITAGSITLLLDQGAWIELGKLSFKNDYGAFAKIYVSLLEVSLHIITNLFTSYREDTKKWWSCNCHRHILNSCYVDNNNPLQLISNIQRSVPSTSITPSLSDTAIHSKPSTLGEKLLLSLVFNQYSLAYVGNSFFMKVCSSCNRVWRDIALNTAEKAKAINLLQPSPLALTLRLLISQYFI